MYVRPPASPWYGSAATVAGGAVFRNRRCPVLSHRRRRLGGRLGRPDDASGRSRRSCFLTRRRCRMGARERTRWLTPCGGSQIRRKRSDLRDAWSVDGLVSRQNRHIVVTDPDMGVEHAEAGTRSTRAELQVANRGIREMTGYMLDAWSTREPREQSVITASTRSRCCHECRLGSKRATAALPNRRSTGYKRRRGNSEQERGCFEHVREEL